MSKNEEETDHLLLDNLLYPLYKIVGVLTLAALFFIVRWIYGESYTKSTTLVELFDYSAKPVAYGPTWKLAFIKGTIDMFSLIITTANTIYATACCYTLAGVWGYITLSTILVSRTCGTVGFGVLALANWVSYILLSMILGKSPR